MLTFCFTPETNTGLLGESLVSGSPVTPQPPPRSDFSVKYLSRTVSLCYGASPSALNYMMLRGFPEHYKLMPSGPDHASMRDNLGVRMRWLILN